MNDLDVVHLFESAQLGKAPFEFIGIDLRLGGCAYCGHTIFNCCMVKSADGKVFSVGSTCIEKVGDRGLIRSVRRSTKQAAEDRKRNRVHAARELLKDARIEQELRLHPHPARNTYPYMAKLTLFDYCHWMLTNAGFKGRITASKIIETTAASLKEGSEN